MDIKILGPGCARCAQLEARTSEAVGSLGLDASITKVTDVAEIASYGVMATPALVVDGVVMASGRIPTARRLRELLTAT